MPTSIQKTGDTNSAVGYIAAFPPLESITRPTVDTAAAAYYLNRRPQTLRGWACNEDGPIRAVRCNGRLAWNVASIKQLMGVA